MHPPCSLSRRSMRTRLRSSSPSAHRLSVTRGTQPRWSSAALQCTLPTVRRYGINGYPTLSVFRAAEPHARHYTGARKASAIVTVRRRADRLAPVSARNVAILQRVVATAVATEAPVWLHRAMANKHANQQNNPACAQQSRKLSCTLNPGSKPASPPPQRSTAAARGEPWGSHSR
jgi:hypothetical protein